MKTIQPRTFADILISPTSGRADLAREFFLAVTGSALIAVCAKIQIGGPVPFTMQSWAVILIGAALGSRRGGLAVSLYLLEGLMGLPVFAGPAAGPAYLFGATGGFLIGFLPAAMIVGWLSERKWDRRFVTAVVAVGIGDAIILALGVVWLSYLVGFRAALDVGLRPLWIADLLKVLLAAAALPGAWRLIGPGTRVP